MSFEQHKARFSIGSIDDRTHKLGISAQYNPKELQYDRSVSWHAGKWNDVEFDSTQGRSLTVELFFDSYETGESVQPKCAVLETLATVIDPDSNDLDKHRPHFCVATWGENNELGIPTLRCVIESVTVKYTMFSALAVPLRATCTVKLKEACVFSKKVKDAKEKAAAAAKKGQRAK
jgi:hypothetical protein